MSDRNLNPHAEALLAMHIWGYRYSRQTGGVMDFWDGLSPQEQRICADLTDKVRAAGRAELQEKEQP